MGIRALIKITLCVTIVVGIFDVTVAVLGAGQDRRFAVPRDPDPPPPSEDPTVSLLRTPSVEFTGEVDSNSPVLRTVVDGEPTLVVFTSFGGTPSRSSGPSLADLSPATPVTICAAMSALIDAGSIQRGRPCDAGPNSESHASTRTKTGHPITDATASFQCICASFKTSARI